MSEYPDIYVFLGSRDIARGESAINDIVNEVGGNERIEVVAIDVADQESVKFAKEKISAKLNGRKMYGIINNAGIGFKSSIKETVGTNYFGTKFVSSTFLPLIDPQEGM